MPKPPQKASRSRQDKKAPPARVPAHADESTGSMDVSRLLDAAMLAAAEDDGEFKEEPPTSITSVLDQVVEEFQKEGETGQKRRKR